MNTKWKQWVSLALAALVCLAMLMGESGLATAARKNPNERTLEKLRDQVKYFSEQPMQLRARTLGVKQVEGKDIAGKGQELGRVRPKKLRDVPIGTDPVMHENEPTVVSSPVNNKYLIAGSHFINGDAGTNRCVAFTSANSGKSWSGPILLPQLMDASNCSDPVLAYAPDGSRVYYAYMDIKTSYVFTDTTVTITDDWDIVVSTSDDDGASWSGPYVALDGDPTVYIFDVNTGELLDFDPGFSYDKNWVGASLEASQRDWVYLTATRFDNFDPFDCHIAFTRSGAMGEPGSWSEPQLLESSQGGCGNPVVVQGSRPVGGRGGDVLVAWFHSGFDGWLNGEFMIRTRYSNDHGATWRSTVTAASDGYELPYWLGPNAFYHRWWGGMFPDVEIDPGGKAYIAYTHDPDPDFASPEDGDIRYASSKKPYNSWNAPVTVNDDGSGLAQGYVAIETRHGGRSSTVYAIWEDHRLSPGDPGGYPAPGQEPNLYYDMFWSRLVPGNSGWRPNERLTDVSSINDFIFIGDYNDLAINNTLVFGVWTDRRHQSNIFEFEDNVFGSRSIP